MKKVLLSALNFILAGVMLVFLICPIASFSKQTKDEKDLLNEGQNALALYFVESLVITDDDLNKAGLDLLAKETELALEYSGDEFETKLYNSAEKNRYDVYNFAKNESLALSHGIISENNNLIVKTKAVSGLIVAYLVLAALVCLISLITIIFNMRKLKGFGTFLTVLAFLVSVVLALVIEFAFNLEGTLTNIVAHVKWPLYIFIAYTFIYIFIRSVLNRKTNK